MEKLTSPRVIETLLKKYDIHFNKRFGQNFLTDENIVNKIANAGEIDAGDLVLEIGPGIGTMTQVLSEHARKVVTVEIDKKLIPVLNETLKDCKNVEIVQGDILKTNVREILGDDIETMPFKIIANLPYYITTPIIMGFLESDLPIESMTFLIQKEVGERLCGEPGTKAYGSLSIVAQFYADIKIDFNVPSHVFIPKPKVDSIVVTLKKLATPRIQCDNKKLFLSIVKASFLNRRKTLINGLTMNTHFDKEVLLQVLEECGIAPGIRGEMLTGKDFANISNHLNKYTA
ncbi:16S rRNA (adenine(1518)-N(6)/adenine(1519)-N(6))-dimethyltransferase RsmA [Acetobacterium fimetarium]|uniref:Ribosomal RNA small subunit methyltransferase A n=1 Tax=Acetobacterium fimetarium TaxID=52691 RepID=A0ABR6WXP6_9FIRM|nr:16S rRNA (adenine(1518)-N(6)/adenine(1519)-N(6))-dimethyltransferase RsmA [Acetobacterium fimetarium]MBC3805377.1 16S rRNA (adenine(1518)-N(6)/adenine(1519)-N(6))-dimethyltransferase RsmA [Acetobacterium fimetarium]